MNKLLLLVISVLNFSSQTFAAGTQQQNDTLKANFLNDTTVKTTPAADPKDGFKNLFEETASAAGFTTQKLNPQAISFVDDYVKSHGNNLNKMKSWGKPYFDLMNDILSGHGLPVELKYLSVIESNLKSGAVSWAGAVGPWQFMPETARLMGLKVTRTRDDRRDYTKSTHAAARYLTQLYGIYGDWLLVIAAYNGGPGNVNSAIRKSGSRDFWKLQYHLPAESRNHVKKFIATHYIMEGQGGLTTLTKRETSDMMQNDDNAAFANGDAGLARLELSGKYNAMVIAQHLKMNLADFNKMNPAFDKILSVKGSYELRLPQEKMDLFQTVRPQILDESVRLMLSASL
ncbi:MAG TPA: lytic transglycosylase domain-containing protein [Chitinophagaceae bacterium]|jgi:membrane-bound lytic murein transglycosylase D|nr:lytic transglycosylase domain-containing protein [Chitinophagaceae bacterium]